MKENYSFRPTEEKIESKERIVEEKSLTTEERKKTEQKLITLKDRPEEQKIELNGMGTESTQEIPPEDTYLMNVDNNVERQPLTPEQKEKIDSALEKLYFLFCGEPSINWKISGGLAISLLKGQYIGTHKDIDITVAKEKLPLLQDMLEERGYAFFLKHGGLSNKKLVQLERVDAEKFAQPLAKDIDRLIGAVDSHGNIKSSADLKFLDVLIGTLNQAGELVPEHADDIGIPQEWLHPKYVYFNGMTFPVDYPGIVACSKIITEKPYNAFDLRQLEAIRGRNALDIRDFDTIERVVSKVIKKIALTDPDRAQRLEHDKNFLLDQLRIMPRTEQERKLWHELEQSGDKPIVTILKRINRFLKAKFPESDIKTTDSCSGHVREGGSIEYAGPSQELLADAPKFIRNHPYKKEAFPHIILKSPVYKVSPEQRNQIETFLEDFFSSAVEKTNKEIGEGSIVLHNTTKPEPHDIYGSYGGAEECYLFAYRFSLSKSENAFNILRAFWKNIEENLSEVDSLPVQPSAKREEFYHPELSKRWTERI